MKPQMVKPPPLIIGIGELLWDLLPAGKQLGGAPANFAYHAQALGAQALIVSCVGNDPLGREILDWIGRFGLRTDGITTNPLARTGTVSVSLDTQGSPTFTIHENVAWDFVEAGRHTLAAAARADAICFGSLAQRSPASRAAIHQVLAAAPPKALRVFDVNLRQRFWSPEIIAESLEQANVLKLNDEELPVVAKLVGLSGDESAQLRRLSDRFNLKAVALTKGANGSSLLVNGKLVSRPGSRLRVVDTVGAGDSYSAALVMGLLAGDRPATVIETAHRIAEYVCTQPGAMPPVHPEWLQQVSPPVPPAHLQDLL